MGINNPTTINKSGGPPLAGNVKLLEGTNVTLSQSGNEITINSSGGGGVAWGAITGTLSSQTDLQTALDGKVDENTAITGATKTKITYDAKGLVTSGADATTADINDSTNRRYVADAQLVVIGNTSGTNTGDQTSIVGITGTKAQFDTAVTDGNILYVGDSTTPNGTAGGELSGSYPSPTLLDRKSTRLNSSHVLRSRMPSSA